MGSSDWVEMGGKEGCVARTSLTCEFSSLPWSTIVSRRLTAWCPPTGFLPDSFLLAAFGFSCVSLSGAYSVDTSAEISMGLCSQECVWVVFLT